MLAYFGERISPHMTDTPEGFLICHDVPIGRTGEMEYLARELQLDGDPERMVRVTRDETEVFSPAALASFEGKPVTDGHPPEAVRPENAAAYHRGHVQNVRREGEYIIADLHLTDANLISEVKNGIKREVSCGYSCLYEWSGSGYRQKQIRGNHVAVVPRGRAGHEVAIKDAALAAKKGRNPMKKETKEAWLRFLGMAAKDAEPEELEQMTRDAAAVLDAGPAEQAQEAGPTSKPAEASDRRLSELDRKVDKLTETMDQLLERFREEEVRDEAPEEKLDRAAEALANGGEKTGKAEAAGVEPSGPADQVTSDAAVRILRSARPVIAAMKDPEEKKRVTDALLESIRTAVENTGGTLLEATAGTARMMARDGDPGGRIKAQQSAYDKRNPHKNKQEEM